MIYAPETQNPPVVRLDEGRNHETIKRRGLMLLKEGAVIRETYEVEKVLGEGAFAEVYRVKHRFLGQRQAMKVFKLGGVTLEETNSILEEASLLSRLEHPNIIRLFEANLADTERGERGFFTMGYVAGGSLEKFWKSYGRAFVPVETTVDVMRQVCLGLSVAHGSQPPIVHRDVKPQNILVGYDSSGLRAKVSDFGLAKRVNPLTMMVSARGTRRFKAPEVYLNPMTDSCAGDVWALGCTLYMLLTDNLPFEDMHEEELTQERMRATKLPPPSSINPAVDPLLDEIVARSLAIDPEGRYETAKEMLEALEAWQPVVLRKKKRKSVPNEPSKHVFGPISEADPKVVEALVQRAIKIARQPGRLASAADLMEEAIVMSPPLRDHYSYLVTLWRSGKVG